jgi:hypothetical protein
MCHNKSWIVIDLTALDISGAASFEIQGLDADRLEMVLSGAGGVRIDSLTATDLVVTVSGAGDVELAGWRVRARRRRKASQVSS